jgi:hypothetical protein
MKNLIRILSVIFLLILLSPCVFGQTEKDSVAVLQKCVELKDLQQFLPLNSDGTVRQLYILQDRISFPVTANVQIAGMKISLVDLAQLENVSDPYFLQFWDFRVSDDKANAGFMLMKKAGNSAREVARVVAAAEKRGTDWVIIDANTVKVQ